jgi:hypothetical protein
VKNVKFKTAFLPCVVAMFVIAVTQDFSQEMGCGHHRGKRHHHEEVFDKRGRRGA